jgi:hypothetical protein
MDQSTATVIGATLALLGVLAGLGVATRKSSRERRDAKTAEFTKDRQAAYRSLWTSVEGLSVALRTEALAAAPLRERSRELNAELLKAGIYIDEADRELASSYVKAVERLHMIASSSKDPAAKVAFEDTGPIPLEVVQKVSDLGEAQEQAMSLRAQLVERIRLVLNDKAI